MPTVFSSKMDVDYRNRLNLHRINTVIYVQIERSAKNVLTQIVCVQSQHVAPVKAPEKTGSFFRGDLFALHEQNNSPSLGLMSHHAEGELCASGLNCYLPMAEKDA